MRNILILVLMAISCLVPRSVCAQSQLQSMATRLKAFGEKLPQEQIFVHLDNSSYYLGDTIFYKAYVRRCDTGRPSDISGVLYCELLNHDGYLIERQMIPLEGGEGHGSFCLTDTALYAGYYEVRTYTRWQLNWGVTEQPHSRWSKDYFFNRSMYRDYYRDYEKLYSRVFPVYNKPLTPGDYSPEMTMRPLSAYYKNPADDPKTTLQLFPEGGELVGGIAQRVAWEVRNESGLELEGTLSVVLAEGDTIKSETTHRGRGMFEITTPANHKLKATFTPTGKNPTGTKSVTEKLPKSVADGVVLLVETDTAGITINYGAAGAAAQEPLGLTIMHDGVLQYFYQLSSETIHFPATKAGVYQVTVFNSEGKVYADRLCFYLPEGFKARNVTIGGVKEENYKAFEPITLEVQGAPGSSMSVSVRDAAKSEYTYDTGSMLTEALLSSQLKGFVPHPHWYFEKDDAEHRQALDLLMMVQGWRRYVWREMALVGEFELTHTPEKRFPHWTGQVHNYTAVDVMSVTEQKQMAFSEQMMSDSESEEEEESSEESENGDTGSTENELTIDSEESESKGGARDRFNKKENSLDYPVAMHAGFTQPGQEAVSGDIKSQGLFELDFPRYYGEFFFFLGASDTTKWKNGNPPVWSQSGRTKKNGIDYPEFYVKLDPIYPRFPKPYDYYQTHVSPMPKESPLYNSANEKVRMLSEVTIGARFNGRRRFGHWRPAFILDAYEAFNATCDAGFAPGYFMGFERFAEDVARTYVGDMKTTRQYDIGIRFDGRNLTERTSTQKDKLKIKGMESVPEWKSNIPDNQLDKYMFLWNLAYVVVYTDYSPRNDMHNKYKGDELPTVTVDLKLLENDTERTYQKNRRWKMKGFSVADEFYSPDYSKQPLPKEDYRRTLYWNPNVKLDENGRATINLYNNSSASILQIHAEGWTPEGEIQSGNVN